MWADQVAGGVFVVAGMSGYMRSRRTVVLITCVLAAGLSVGEGIPSPAEAPDISLGWPFLLMVERAVALAALVLVAHSMAVSVARGDTLIRAGSLEFDRVNKKTRISIEEQEERLVLLEVLAGIRPASDLDGPAGRG